MKKGIVLLFAVCLLLSASINVFAKEVEVYVSIAVGELKLAYEKVTVSDIDGDNALTINDALYCAHQLKYKGEGNGYASSKGPYGTRIDKLWGVVNGDAYGYYLNNNTAMSLDDEIKNNDHVYAFVYTDLNYFSDTYSFFDKQKISSLVGENFDLTLTSMGYDEAWNIALSNVGNAIITINGEKTKIKTNQNGKAVLNFDKKGKYVISACLEDGILVPAVCIVNIKNDDDMTATPGDVSLIPFIILSIASLSGCILCFLKKQNEI